jgi:hypothetical protein
VGTTAAAAALAACSPAGSSIATSYQRYTYTCCDGQDTQRVWHPGETFTLRWVAQPSGMTGDSAPQRVTLTAVMTGPYRDISALKSAPSAAPLTVSATPIVTTDLVDGNPVSSILLPVTLPAGFYNVVDAIELTGGQSSGATIIQVAPAGP